MGAGVGAGKWHRTAAVGSAAGANTMFAGPGHDHGTTSKYGPSQMVMHWFPHGWKVKEMEMEMEGHRTVESIGTTENGGTDTI